MSPNPDICPRTWAQRCRAWGQGLGAAGAGAAVPGGAQGISIAELVDLHGRGGSRPLLLMLLACLCLPPIMGLGTAMSLAMFAIAWQWGHPSAAPLPQRLGRARLNPAWSRRTLHALAWLHDCAATWIRPRLTWLSHRASHTWWALWIVWMALLIFIPLPLGNILPGLGLIALCLGWMHRDGLMLLLSLLLGAIGTAYASGIVAVAVLAAWRAFGAVYPPLA
ncbi:exopolysaccharide biosynthesis protein [Serpentinimonas barnesii]|uniref:exopolysaccharide biosynthesis protein n=1 Tax=Serpentinimonas barnesii TaxID=1458427 RepID=UPI00049717CE|nr:exopolysaccharide biosynthesis protein [Serpentinimonas barnesii]